MTTPRDPRADATALLPDGHVGLVLEPSPPAAGPPDFADDPIDATGLAGTVVSPVDGHGDRTWAAVVAAADDAELAAFAREHWLGPRPALAPLPDGYASTRDALGRLAVHVVYRARRQVNGKFGLRWTAGGFGTPFFAGDDGVDEQVRVQGARIVRQRGDTVASSSLTSLRAAGAHVDVDVDPDFDHGFGDVADAGDLDADLDVDVAAADALGDWFGFVQSLLQQVRVDRADAVAGAAGPSPAQLWPEHFDLAIDLAFAAGDGQRVNIGGSPGDGGHADPYLYVGPWTDDRPGGDGYWNRGFGAVLGHADIVGAGDAEAQRSLALGFIREGLDRLSAD